jgi:hypothetical protein
MGDAKLLEEAIFQNCQFLQAGRAETSVQFPRPAWPLTPPTKLVSRR